MELLRAHRCFGGIQGAIATIRRHRHADGVLPFTSRRAEASARPVLYWLSGLTCTWANFTEKAGAQRYAAGHGLMIVAPDTSPRGTDLRGSTTPTTSARAPASTSMRPRALVAQLPDVHLRHRRAARPGHRQLPDRCRPPGHLRPFHGRPRRADLRPESRTLRSVSAFAPIVAPPGALGPQGVRRLSGR